MGIDTSNCEVRHRLPTPKATSWDSRRCRSRSTSRRGSRAGRDSGATTRRRPAEPAGVQGEIRSAHVRGSSPRSPARRQRRPRQFPHRSAQAAAAGIESLGPFSQPDEHVLGDLLRLLVAEQPLQRVPPWRRYASARAASSHRPRCWAWVSAVRTFLVSAGATGGCPRRAASTRSRSLAWRTAMIAARAWSVMSCRSLLACCGMRRPVSMAQGAHAVLGGARRPGWRPGPGRAQRAVRFEGASCGPVAGEVLGDLVKVISLAGGCLASLRSTPRGGGQATRTGRVVRRRRP